MNAVSAERLAIWIARTHPALFDALAEQAGAQLTPPGMQGLFDAIQSVGSTVGTAVKNVGSFLNSSQGVKTLTELGGVYMQTQAQRAALQLQIAQARANAAPFAISNVPHLTSGIQEPWYIAADGRQYPLTPQLSQRLRPVAGVAQYLPWLLLGGGILVAVFLLSRR